MFFSSHHVLMRQEIVMWHLFPYHPCLFSECVAWFCGKGWAALPLYIMTCEQPVPGYEGDSHGYLSQQGASTNAELPLPSPEGLLCRTPLGEMLWVSFGCSFMSISISGWRGVPLVSRLRVPWGPRFSYNSCILSKEAPITGGDWRFHPSQQKNWTRLLSLNILYLHTRQVVGSSFALVADWA